MKKTLIALAALASMAVAGETNSLTLGSYYTSNGQNYDAVTNLFGKTDAQAEAVLGTGKADQLAFDSKSLSNLSPLTLNTGSMLSSDAALATGTELTLTGLTILARENDTHQAQGTTVSVTIDGTTYTSTAVAYDKYTNADNAVVGYRKVTYTFTDGPIFELGDTLAFTFTLPSTVGDLNKIPAAALQGLSGTDSIYNVWQGAFQLTANTTIPEPTTATLSLLALAGLAARRRRR